MRSIGYDGFLLTDMNGRLVLKVPRSLSMIVNEDLLPLVAVEIIAKMLSRPLAARVIPPAVATRGAVGVSEEWLSSSNLGLNKK